MNNSSPVANATLMLELTSDSVGELYADDPFVSSRPGPLRKPGQKVASPSKRPTPSRPAKSGHHGKPTPPTKAAHGVPRAREHECTNTTCITIITDLDGYYTLFVTSSVAGVSTISVFVNVPGDSPTALRGAWANDIEVEWVDKVLVIETFTGCPTVIGKVGHNVPSWLVVSYQLVPCRLTVTYMPCFMS
jgi:hypothetical protein